MCELFYNNEDKYSYFFIDVLWQEICGRIFLQHITVTFFAENFVEIFSIICNTEIRFATYFSVFPNDFWIQNINVKISSDLVIQKFMMKLDAVQIRESKMEKDIDFEYFLEKIVNYHIKLLCYGNLQLFSRWRCRSILYIHNTHS